MSELLPVPGSPPPLPGHGARSPAGAAEPALPADAFAALLAQLLPGRLPPGLRPLARAQGGADVEPTADSGDATGTDAADGAGGNGTVAAEPAATANDPEANARPHRSSPVPESVGNASAGSGVSAGYAGAVAGEPDASGITGGESERGDHAADAASATSGRAEGSAAAAVPVDTAAAGTRAEAFMAPVAADPRGDGSRAASATGTETGGPHASSSAELPAGAAGRAAAAPESAAAAAGGRAGAGIDPTRIEREMALLHPEFRVRLERVVVRMAEEHGHDVRVVETLRHQARQDYLFAQGRSRPGEVVTWTRSSNHTTGVAADVIVDGSYGDPAAYARLQRIAAQEGLRTLGPRDPGHVELAVDGAGGPTIAGSGGAEPTEPTAAGPTDRPHRAPRGLASPAAVARPAAVPRVARPADVTAPEVAAVATPATPAATAGRDPSPGPARERPERESVAPAPRLAESAAPTSGAEPARAAAGQVVAEPGGPRPEPAAPTLTSGAAARIAHLLDLQTAAPIRPLSQILLRVDGPDGEDRIRLDLRGRTLSGSIDVGDPVAAERLDARIAELQRSLEHHGLEAQGLRVRAAAAADAAEHARFAMATLDADPARVATARTAADASPQRERAFDQSRDDARQGAPDSRQRSRREHRGGDSK